MGVCCVEGCEPDDADDVAYFPLPIAPTLRRKWREAIQPSSKLHSDSRICSRHFPPADYVRVRGKLRLKGRRVPSLFDNKKACPSPSPRARGARRSADRQDGGEQNGADDELHTLELSVPEFGTLEAVAGRGEERREEDHDDNNECTIECVPEAILHEDSDSRSSAEIHKEDIEDIIANYHIQQHSKLRAPRARQGDAPPAGGSEMERPRPQNTDKEKNGETQESSEETDEPDKGRDKDRNKDKRKDGGRDGDKSKDGDKDGGEGRGGGTPEFIEISVDAAPSTKEKEKDKDGDKNGGVARGGRGARGGRPEFIEISVDAVSARGRRGRSSPAGAGGDADDCMILLENVQVDIDPCTLYLPPEQEPEQEDTHRRGDPISLLTSSDEDDVILQEPHVDTVELSSETDEDDKPLVTLVRGKIKDQPTRLTRLFWGNLQEYYCFQCKFTTFSQADHQQHKLEHSKILYVCERCKFTCASKSQFSRHKKKHRLEKRFKCKYCDYKARHNMSLVYHLKSHDEALLDDVPVPEDEGATIKDRFRCSDCRFTTDSRPDMLRHIRTCVNTEVKVKDAEEFRFRCSDCSFSTDSRRAMARHARTCAEAKDKPVRHKCDQCEYSTKRRNDLKRHRQRKHAARGGGDAGED